MLHRLALKAGDTLETSRDWLGDPRASLLAWWIPTMSFWQACFHQSQFEPLFADEVEHSLGKGEVDSSILSGSPRKNPEKSETFSRFECERSTIRKSRKAQNDPATSTFSDPLVGH